MVTVHSIHNTILELGSFVWLRLHVILACKPILLQKGCLPPLPLCQCAVGCEELFLVPFYALGGWTVDGCPRSVCCSSVQQACCVHDFSCKA